MNTVMKRTLLITALLAAACLSMFAAPASAAEKAVVDDNALLVRSDATKGSAVVDTLRNGEAVTIQYEINGDGGKWCYIEASRDFITGYVPCSGLRSGTAGAAAGRSGGQYSDVKVVMYMTDW